MFDTVITVPYGNILELQFQFSLDMFVPLAYVVPFFTYVTVQVPLA